MEFSLEFNFNGKKFKEKGDLSLQQILKNASMDYNEFVERLDKVRRRNYGFDVKKKRFGNMFSLGIIDPLKVTKNALQNAISVSITILTTNCVISNKRA